jgi:hypothetical protein
MSLANRILHSVLDEIAGRGDVTALETFKYRLQNKGRDPPFQSPEHTYGSPATSYGHHHMAPGRNPPVSLANRQNAAKCECTWLHVAWCDFADCAGQTSSRVHSMRSRKRLSRSPTSLVSKHFMVVHHSKRTQPD